MIWLCVLGAMLIGWAPIFVRWIELGPTVVGFYRCLGGALILLPVALIRTPLWSILKSRKDYLLAAVIAGILFGLDLAVWHRSVRGLGAGLATVLGNTQVFHVAWIGYFFLGERIKKSFLLYMLFGFIGLYVLIGDRPLNMNSDVYRNGVILGLVTGVLYASYMTFLRRLESLVKPLPAYANLGIALFFSAITLAIIATFNGEWTVPSPTDWSYIAGLVLVPQVLGWVLITKSLSTIPVSLAGLIILLQPLISSMLGVWIFNETFTNIQIGGALLLLISVYRGSVIRARA